MSEEDLVTRKDPAQESARERWVKQSVEAWHEDVKPTGIAWWKDIRNDWKLHIITAVIAAVLLLIVFWPSKADAAKMSEYSVVTGNIYQMAISVCVEKKDALAIMEAEKISHEHASKLFDAIDTCNNIPATFRVGPVHHTMTSPKGDTYRVVEVQMPADPSAKLYWMTSMNVVAAVTKPGVKSDSISKPFQAKQA